MFVCAAIWIVLDIAWLTLGAVIAHGSHSGLFAEWESWELSLTYVGGACLMLGFVLLGAYTGRRSRKPLASMAYMSLLVLLALVVIDQILLRVHIDHVDALKWLDIWLLASLLLMALSRMALAHRIRRLGGISVYSRRIVVAGDARYLQRWTGQSVQLRDDFRIVAAIGVTGAASERELLSDIAVLPDMAALEVLARGHQFDELWLALPMSAQEEIHGYVLSMQHYFVDIRLLADAQKLPLFNPAATTLAGSAFIDLVSSPKRDDASWVKPLFDRSFAALALLLLLPVLLAVALAVKLSSPGPVFFRQRRKGMDGREFTILKFRSMRVHAEEAGKVTQAGKHDKRVTVVGRALRKTSLDELPQFINVLLGQMSVVGPRPHALEHDDFYMRLIDGYMYRYRIRPGITGWAQVNGFRGETAKVESMARRVAMDLFYIQHWSFWLDLRIVVMTIFKGFTGKNAY